jgi:hypothetical protein
MKKTVQIAPYTATIEEEHRVTHVLVRDEHGKQVLRANYDKFLGRYDGIKITVRKTATVHDVVTVMDSLVEEF